MEELKQQVRRSALWRFWGFWIFIIALTVTFLLSTHLLNASKGIMDVRVLKQENKAEKDSWQEEREELENRKKQLTKELNECENENNPDKILAECEGEILLVQDENLNLSTDLQLCESNLRAIQLNN